MDFKAVVEKIEAAEASIREAHQLIVAEKQIHTQEAYALGANRVALASIREFKQVVEKLGSKQVIKVPEPEDSAIER